MPNEDVIQVKDRNGKVVPIFKKNLAEAIKRGASPVIPEAKQQDAESGDNSFLESLRSSMGLQPKGGFMTDVKQIGEGFKDIGTRPLESIKALGEGALESQKEVGQKATTELQSPDWKTKVHGLIREIYAGLPLLGPVLNRAGEQFEAGHYKGGLGTMTPVLVGEAGKAPIVQRAGVRAAEAVERGVKETPPKIVQSVTGAKYAVDKAQKAAERAAQEKMSSFEKAESERAAEVEAQRAAKEARDTKAAGEHKAATQRELVRARGEHESEMGGVKAEAKKQAAEYKKNLDNKARVEAENAKNEATRQVLSKQVETGTKELTQNIKTTIDNAKKNFDKEYGDFDRQILGKTPQNPKGTLQANLDPVIQAVLDARQNIIAGTPENIKQFSSILERGEQGVGEGGEIMVPAQQTIPVSDLRGYITELESKMYDSNVAPDIRQAIKSVVEPAKNEVAEAIRDVHGKSAEAAYKDLNKRYSDYLTDWRDTSTTNPLPKVRNKLLEGVAQNNPDYPVHLDIGRALKGANAQKAMVLLEKYRNFGADPKILADYNKALQQLDELPKAQKVPDVKKPKMPEPSTSVPLRLKKPPETEPFTPRGKDPEAPQIEPFDRQTMMRNTIEERMNMAGRIGQGFKLLKMVSDMIHANPAGALTEAEQMAVIEAIRRSMTSDRALNYFSKEAK